jgi:glycosyltransferase involved in cell wall biosynthesis
LPRLARRLRGDVLHCPHYTMPVWETLPGQPSVKLGGIPTVVTLHDATFFSDPKLHEPVKRLVFTRATRRAVEHATELLVPSAATREELGRLVSPLARRAVVAPLGVDHSLFRPPGEGEGSRIGQLLGLADHGDYLAFLGTIEPRKNVAALIRAWTAACAGRSRPPALVIAGGAGWDSAVDEAAEAVPDGLRLIRAGYLPLGDIPALLGGAAVVVYPSLGEGFGLPVLEAMACGAPVLTTRRLALPEVGGDAVAYTETDTDAIASAISALLDDPDRRTELRRAGLARAAEFTWQRTARIHAEVYRRAAASVPV